MEKTLNQHRSTEESATAAHEDARTEATVRAVAQLLANPRRTRRD
ncbi:hypothetical protein [Blastococcus montanus]